MQLIFRCPRCSRPQRVEAVETVAELSCAECDFSRPLPADAVTAGRPVRCLCCDCRDLWRQKDFPQSLGLLMVGLGMLFSTIAWAKMEPVWAIGILMAFALVDMLLFVLMPDVLVCYRCGARHRRANAIDDHPRFSLETHERYRQEAIRLEEAGGPRNGA